MAKVGYIRVSTVDQNTGRQLNGLEFDKVFEDQCSGKDTNRPKLQTLLDYVRDGDEVHVHDISRLARNLEDLIQLVKNLNSNGVAVHFHKEHLIFTGEQNPMQDLMLNVMGAVYEFERSMTLERQREGIAKAKAAGKYSGRQKTVNTESIIDMLNNGVSYRKTAEILGVSLSTVQRAKKQNN